jgi:hypothetical protein
MNSAPFVTNRSIVRQIWGKADTVLFIFAGAAAEFSLNKAVDWLYFTGNLPADPLGRLFSTVAYARMIVFSDIEEANAAIDRISAIHKDIEKMRVSAIPDWAYRDVLFMLIYYSIVSFELLERKLTPEEKEEVYNVFYRVGNRMGLSSLPANYLEWLPVRDAHMLNDLVKSDYTADLFKQYNKHLGLFRFFVLKESQKMVVPLHAKKLLGFVHTVWLKPLIPFYKLLKRLQADWLVKSVLLPNQYKAQISALDTKQTFPGGIKEAFSSFKC